MVSVGLQHLGRLLSWLDKIEVEVEEGNKVKTMWTWTERAIVGSICRSYSAFGHFTGTNHQADLYYW
jgi:hypothetical protein